MKAAVHSGGEIRIQDVQTPVPKDNEVLVRIHAATVCAADYRIGHLLRSTGGRVIAALRRKPIIMGMELAGTVQSVGKNVTRFSPGDQVFGGTGFKFATQAEYGCALESQLEKKPASMTVEESAAVMFGGFTALAFMKMVKIQPGQNVLVYGASGSVGVFAVQLAKHFGARVTGVCSTGNLNLVKSIGADAVVDYTREDFSSAGRIYDVVFDAVGKSGFSRTLKCLRRGGPYVRAAPSGGIRLSSLLASMLGDTLRQTWISMTGTAKIIGGVPRVSPEDLSFLKRLIDAGELRTVIDRCYPLEKIAEAYRYAERGHKKGHVVIVMPQSSGGG